MKKAVAVLTLMFLGTLLISLNWSCITGSSIPTFPDALAGNAAPTSTPCGFPGLTCTPTPTVVMCMATPVFRNTPVVWNNTVAGNDYYASGCGGSGADVVYRFTLSTSRTVTVTTCMPGNTIDTVLSLLSSCDPVVSLACNDWSSTCTGGFNPSLIVAPLTAGTYWIVVDGYYSGSPGTYELLLTY